MKVQVARPGELGESHAELWMSLQHSSSKLSPFLSLTFAKVVDRFRSNARVAVVYDGSEVTAFLPYEIGVDRRARPIGWPMNDAQGIISSEPLADIRRVVKKAGLRAWSFDNALASPIELGRHCYRGSSHRATFADLSTGFEDYFDSRGKTVIKEFERRRRALERDLGPLTFQWQSGEPADLDKLIEWKSAHYLRTNVTGEFAVFSDPRNVSIVRALAESRQADCEGVVSVLLIGDRPIAIRFGMLGPGGLTSQFPSYDRELGRYSPGTMMWFTLAKEAVRRGITRIDFGGGGENYKTDLATDSYELLRGCVWGNLVESHGRRLARLLMKDAQGRKRFS
ncbi:MAG: GNAT family N-acetyltransferase [Acidobacteria bacterium]|nr:GNAT family N-acetyltransferase [Acidobacteriota bacterium]